MSISHIQLEISLICRNIQIIFINTGLGLYNLDTDFANRKTINFHLNFTSDIVLKSENDTNAKIMTNNEALQ